MMPLQGLGGGGSADNMGLGFIVSKVGVGNTTINNADLGGSPYTPLFRLGSNISYTPFDGGRSVEINAIPDGNGIEDTGGATAGGELNMSNNKIINVATPTNQGDAANKDYVD